MTSSPSRWYNGSMIKLFLSLGALAFVGVLGCGDTGTTDEPSCDQLACDDGNACTSNACDDASGQCVHDPVADGSTCELAGESGVCSNGACVAPICTELACDDGNPCTIGECNAGGTECIFEDQPDGTFCSEGRGFGVCLEAECASGDVEFSVTVAPIIAPRVTYFVTCSDVGSVSGELEDVDGAWVTGPLLFPVTPCMAEFSVREQDLTELCVGSVGFTAERDELSSIDIVLSCSAGEE